MALLRTLIQILIDVPIAILMGKLFGVPPMFMFLGMVGFQAMWLAERNRQDRYHW